MGFKSFKLGILVRVIILTLLLLALVILVQDATKLITSIVVAFLVVITILEIYRYVTTTNRKLTRFFESIQFSDFSSGFSFDDSLGKSFKDLNISFNKVLEAFRRTRSEKEENWQYLSTVTQQIRSGILSFDQSGDIKLINSAAKRFLGLPQIKNISELEGQDPELLEILTTLKAGESFLYERDPKNQISIKATEIVIRGDHNKLINFQNIQSELQRKEIESWQNLTRVLRHEIMNSITPIASLTSTMKEIIVEDLKKTEEHFELKEDTVDDLQEGLDTIESRSKGLIRFIDAYRDFTNIPEPKRSTIIVEEMIEHIVNFHKVEARKAGVELSYEVTPSDLKIYVDEELLEQVLINLVKNAIEATEGRKDPNVAIKVNLESNGSTSISVRDNGPGIIPEALERIFIPFYTTKNQGSGIGLALSRQIVNMHNGTLSVDSEVDKYTEFTINL